jgi:hypothetical protein
VTGIAWQRKGSTAACVLINPTQAYDTVNREILWKKLMAMGMGGKFVRMLQGLYKDDRFNTEVNGEKTRDVYLGRGLRQGCSLR